MSAICAARSPAVPRSSARAAVRSRTIFVCLDRGAGRCQVAAKARRPRRDHRRIEIEVAIEAMRGEHGGKMARRAEVDVPPRCPVERQRAREQHVVGCAGEVRDGGVGVGTRDVREDFLADDQVVAVGQLVGDRRPPAGTGGPRRARSRWRTTRCRSRRHRPRARAAARRAGLDRNPRPAPAAGRSPIRSRSAIGVKKRSQTSSLR